MVLRFLSRFCAGLKEGLGFQPRRAAAGRPGRAPWRGPVGILLAVGIVILAGVAGLGVLAWKNGRLPALPFGTDSRPGPARSLGATPEEVASDLDLILALEEGVPPRHWTAVVLHHSATAGGCAHAFDAYHRAKGWTGLAYHFVIGNGTQTPDGAIETGPRWLRQEPAPHANSVEFNQSGIAVCLVGNFENAPPSPAQVRAARMLVRELARRFSIPRERVFTHAQVREGGGTACPGRLFPLDEVLQGF